jgi:ATP-dependent DNA helicase RecG
MGLYTIGELVENLPRRYEDYSEIVKVSNLSPGVRVICAKVSSVSGRYVRKGMHITEAIASDSTGSVRLVWFNQPYRKNSIKHDNNYLITGNFDLVRGRFCFTSPQIELESSFPLSTARIVPVYRQSKNVSALKLRRILRTIFSDGLTLPISVPKKTTQNFGLLEEAHALEQVHFPDSTEMLDEAKRTLGFYEVFCLVLAGLANKQESMRAEAHVIEFKQEVVTSLLDTLPYKLTDDQKKALWLIYKDIANKAPMNRLIQGDVGSGKTIVAGLAAAMTLQQGLHVAFLAPTQLLANQHFSYLQGLLASVFEVKLVVGGKAKHSTAQDSPTLYVGTTALLHRLDTYSEFGLIVVDEQHRFGVEQRNDLLKKSKKSPHLLAMTATPIPRSLALTLFGELSIAVIKQMPEGRLPIKTKLVLPGSRTALYARIEEELKNGRQMFVVCPEIEERKDKIGERKVNVTTVSEELAKQLKNYKIGVLHGKLSNDIKDTIMAQFLAKELDVLVSTTVIEVGVHVPNATVMVIEGADGFGLAQLHQLRGRVGRGAYQGYCYLIPRGTSIPPRLRALEQSNDGFELAEQDLRERGPGAIYGLLQSGALDLRYADINDHVLLKQARDAAVDFFKNDDIKKHAELYERVSQLQRVTRLN